MAKAKMAPVEKVSLEDVVHKLEQDVISISNTVNNLTKVIDTQMRIIDALNAVSIGLAMKSGVEKKSAKYLEVDDFIKFLNEEMRPWADDLVKVQLEADNKFRKVMNKDDGKEDDKKGDKESTSKETDNGQKA